jgi:transketolase
LIQTNTAQAISTETAGSELMMRGLRARILEVAAASGEGHIPSALSILDILWVLYDRVLNISPLTIHSSGRDRFVMSKGHASLGLYAVLAEKRFFPSSALESFGRYDSFLGGHPDCNKVPGVEASTGSLGHGFPIAVGMAMGLRIQHNPARVYCIVGDGESNEGTIWESAALAAHHRLDNLHCIVDYNHSTDRALSLGDMGAKFAAFDWAVCEVDGHDHEALHEALTWRPGAPVCVIANTVKGHGCRPMEGNPAWHHKSPSASELSQLLGTLS